MLAAVAISVIVRTFEYEIPTLHRRDADEQPEEPAAEPQELTLSSCWSKLLDVIGAKEVQNPSKTRLHDGMPPTQVGLADETSYLANRVK